MPSVRRCVTLGANLMAVDGINKWTPSRNLSRETILRRKRGQGETVFLLTGPHAFEPKYVYIGHKILMKQPHDCSY